MNFFQINKIKKVVTLSLIIVFSFASPVSVVTATDYKSSNIKSTTDCPEVTEKAASITAAVSAWFTTFGTEKAADQIGVPANTGAASTGSGATASATTESSMWNTWIQPLGKCIAYKAGQIMLDNFTQKTVDWIKSGMNGSPLYAVDPNQMANELGDAVAGNLARKIESYALCDFTSTFKNDLRNWVVVGQTDPDIKVRQALKCPFDQINASDFYRGAQAFTWKAFETSLNDSGNPYGVAVITQNELTASQHRLASAAKQQLDWGQGFLSVVDPDNCPNMPQEVRDYIESADAVPSGVSAYQSAYCEKVTPAQLVENQLTKATGIEWDRLGAADDINKILNAFVTKVSNDAIQGIFRKL